MTTPAALPASRTDVEFVSFVTEHTVALTRFAYVMCGSRADADDVVQDALIRLYAAWSRVRPEGELAYARRIVARQASNHHRRNRREIASDRLPEESIAGRDPADLLALRRAIAALPPRQRAVVALRYYEDLPETAVADTLGIKVGTVKSQLARATATLRRLLHTPDHESGAHHAR